MRVANSRQNSSHAIFIPKTILKSNPTPPSAHSPVDTFNWGMRASPPANIAFEESFTNGKKDNGDRADSASDKEIQIASWYQLDLSNMGIRSVSREIRYYPHITALFLNNNKLTEVPEEIFTELRSLTILDLSFNIISRLPVGIGHLIDLEKLFLGQNRLTELPVEVGQLFKLKELQLEGNPLTSPPLNIVQAGSNMVISYLRDRVPAGPPPPERRFISYIDPHVTISEKEKFRVMTYNILAESYATPDRYYYCPAWALDWNYRKQGILKELLTYDCDIICLQEVESGQYRDFFLPEMMKAGYAGILAPKSRARTMEDWSTVDGCVIFFKKSKFNLVEEHLFEYQSIAINRHKDFGDDPETFSRLMTKDNVAIAIVLQLKDYPETALSNGNSTTPPLSPTKNGRAWVPVSQQQQAPKGKHILVANTHIHWNPDHKDVKLMQVELLLEELHNLIGSPKSKWYKIPMILAGDFNSTTESGPYELLSTGKLKPRHTDLEPYNYGEYSSKGMYHQLGISSAYAPLGEPQFTNFTADYVGVLDYVWYTHESLSVSKVLQPVDEENARITRLPNAYMNSDHISLLSEFIIKKI